MTHTIESVIAEIREEIGVRADKMARAQIEAYAGQIVRLRDAQQRIAEEGLIVPDSKNQPVAHPALAIEKQAQDEIRKWGEKFRPPPRDD